MKNLLFIFAGVMLAAKAPGGIYRHDVSPEKYKKLAQQKQFDCVGMVMDAFGRNMCGSCVLVGNKYVLSAAHVFMVSDEVKDTVYYDKEGKQSAHEVKGGTRTVFNKQVNERPGNADRYGFRFNRRLYKAKAMKIFPSFLDTSDKGGNLVLIELDDTVKGIVPATLNTSFDELNSTITGVGYGTSGPADDPELIGLFMEKIAGQNVVDKTEGWEWHGKPSVMSSDMDHPTRADCNKMGAAQPLPMEYICGGGDSGGGAFRHVGTQWALAGIITGGGVVLAQFRLSGYYGQLMHCTRVSVFYDWIQETIRGFKMQEIQAGIKKE